MINLPTLESLQVDFASAGDAAMLRDLGWAKADDGLIRMLGARSSLGVDLPDREGALFLQVKIAPLLGLPLPQRLRLIINGYEIAAHEISRAVTLTDYVPPDAVAAAGMVRLVLEHPANGGDMALGVRSLRLLRVIERPSRSLPRHGAPEAPPLRQMLLDFESLGEGPAFALFRQRHGVRPLDLLQAGHAGLADWLTLLDSDFTQLVVPGTIQAVETTHPDGEPTWSVGCAGTSLHYDSGVAVSASPATALVAREQARLAIAVRRLREALAAGSKILLFAQETPAADEEMIPLLAAVQDCGPNTILWVTSADAEHPAGSIEVLMNGLLRGYVPPGHDDEAWSAWTQLCRRAWRSWRAMTTDPADAQAA